MATCPAGHASAAGDFCDVCGLLIEASAAAPGGQGEGGTPGSPPGRTCPNCGAPRFGQFCEACGLDFATGRLPAGTGAVFAPSGSAPSGSVQSAPAAAADAVPASAVPPTPADSPVRPVPDPGPLPVPDAPSAPAWGSPAPPDSWAAPVPPAQRDPAAGSVPAAVSGSPAVPSGQAAAEVPAAARGGPDDWSALVSADRAYYDRIQEASGPDAASIGFPAYCAERRFRLAGREMRIGRHSASRGINPEIDLTGPPSDPGISRLHAVLLERPDGGWAVLDPGSANGTLVNGAEIPVGEQVALRDGDRINLGAWTAITIMRAEHAPRRSDDHWVNP